MGPKSTRVHFPLDSFDSAGQSFGDRCFPDQKRHVREGHGLVMTHEPLQRFENVYDRSRWLRVNSHRNLYPPAKRGEYLGTTTGKFIAEDSTSCSWQISANSSRTSCIFTKLKCLTSWWKPSSDFGSILWLPSSWKNYTTSVAPNGSPNAPVMDDSWLRSSNKAFKASCGLPSRAGLGDKEANFKNYAAGLTRDVPYVFGQIIQLANGNGLNTCQSTVCIYCKYL